ncbi:response regulator transcription factor [Oceanobacillus alkalisoli]|uniref:response regulator transcription factor n=1 Tax=Oceanobacillus alkalisoli TaxID=2925113 RepID=UPI001F122273|nr:response regulator transcription factor [Oceanobacillus alkalisoli]MCF3943929.1 response regulator transcription factor [Oceanobacillus alkalisoli]
MAKILIIEDDPKIATLLQNHLQKYGYDAVIAEQFDAITEEFQQIQPDLLLLDINLPSFDGFYWCRQIRQISTCPIIFISARSGEMDQVMALENGGDDYITKPFAYEVVVAKIKSNLRRAYGEYAPKVEERTIELEGLTLYVERLELVKSGEVITLTKKEAVLLEVLMSRSPRVVSRDLLLEKLWDDQAFVDENTLNVNVTRVRKRLQELGIQGAIETIRGAGYRLIVNWEQGS